MVGVDVGSTVTVGSAAGADLVSTLTVGEVVTFGVVSIVTMGATVGADLGSTSTVGTAAGADLDSTLTVGGVAGVGVGSTARVEAAVGVGVGFDHQGGDRCLLVFNRGCVLSFGFGKSGPQWRSGLPRRHPRGPLHQQLLKIWQVSAVSTRTFPSSKPYKVSPLI